MIVLADNDVVHKLSCSDLLQELLQWLEVPPNEIWVLPSLYHVLKKRLKNDTKAMDCLNSFLSRTKQIPPANAEQLERFASLDIGEQQMFAIFVDDTFDSSRLVTGDKRALISVNKIAAKDGELYQRLDGRVESLESIMVGLIQCFGFDAINTKIIQGTASDTVLRMAFGAHRDHAHAMQLLNSYQSDLQSQAPFIIKRIE